MCGRYVALSDEENKEIMDIIREVESQLNGTPELEKLKTGEIFPTNVAPILTRDGPRAMKWGFAKWDGKGVIINSRSEGLLESKMFRKPALESRCLVPASHYFEWEGEGKSKIKQRIKCRGKSLCTWPVSSAVSKASLTLCFLSLRETQRRKSATSTTACLSF